MPITQINSVAALVVIDLQKGIVGLDTAHPTADIGAAGGRLPQRRPPGDLGQC